MGIYLSLVRLLKKKIHQAHIVFQKFKEISELPSYILGKLGASLQHCVALQSPSSISCLCPLTAKDRGQEGQGVQGDQQHPPQHEVTHKWEKWAARPLLVVGCEI